jgi:hypothetical protein
LATIVYFNKYLSSIILKDVKGPKASEDKLKEIYKSKPLLKPAFDYVRNEIKLIPNFWISKLKSLAEVKNLVTGKSVSIQVNDSEGKA